MTKMLRSRWLWALLAISASPGLIAWLLGVSDGVDRAGGHDGVRGPGRGHAQPGLTSWRHR